MARNFLGAKVSVLNLDSPGSPQRLVSIVKLRPSVQVTLNLQNGLAASRRRKYARFCSKPSEATLSQPLSARTTEPVLLGQISDITEFVSIGLSEPNSVPQIPTRSAGGADGSTEGPVPMIPTEPASHLVLPRWSSDEIPVWIDRHKPIPRFAGLVSILGVGKGHGFGGVIARYGFARGPMTRGSGHHRAPGSAGAGTFPSRVYPKKKMPGKWGNSRRAYKNVQQIKLDVRHGLLWLQGSIPGKQGNIIRISPL